MGRIPSHQRLEKNRVGWWRGRGRCCIRGNRLCCFLTLTPAGGLGATSVSYFPFSLTYEGFGGEFGGGERREEKGWLTDVYIISRKLE